jgi:hypothetical protein
LRKSNTAIHTITMDEVPTHLKLDEFRCIIGNQKGIKVLNAKTFEVLEWIELKREFTSSLQCNDDYILSGTQKKGEIKIYFKYFSIFYIFPISLTF